MKEKVELTREEKIKQFSDFKKSLTSMSKEELEKLLAEITEDSKNLDKEVSETKFELPEKDQEKVFGYIKSFLNTQKIKWQFVYNMISIYEFFDSKQKTIEYALLDTVLRMLGQFEYTGIEEWKNVKAINEYFAPIAVKYAEIGERIYLYADKYAAVDGQLQLFNAAPAEEVVDTKE